MRFNNIQIARLVAAGAVTLMHVGGHSRLTHGADDLLVDLLEFPWVGAFFVPLFFAVSGFVLTHNLQAASPAQFLARRATRLYPGYWLVIGVVYAACRAGVWPGTYLLGYDPDPTIETVLLTPPTGFRPGQYLLIAEWTLIYEVFFCLALAGICAAAGAQRVPVVAAGWLVLLAGKSALWPGVGTKILPSWQTIWVSAHVVPFLAGVLAYSLARRGRAGRWPLLAAVVAANAAAVALGTDADVDQQLWRWGLSAGVTVWFLVQIPDAEKSNPLVRWGGYSYGLYLAHVPLLLLVFRLEERAGGLAGTAAGAALAAAVALTCGLTYGRLEWAMYTRLKPAADWIATLGARLRRPRVPLGGLAGRLTR